MNTWSVIYEYCDTHPDCADDACQKTVLIHSFAVPSVDLRTSRLQAKRLTVRAPMPLSQILGFMLLAVGIGGIFGPFIPTVRLEAQYAIARFESDKHRATQEALPASAPLVFEPLTTPDGASIAPVNTDFSLIIPKIGVNAPVMANIDPSDPKSYDEALAKGVAHASTSFLPNQNGSVYLFSHSTNYDWFVRDLNAIFYLLKNLGIGDSIVVFYQGKEYSYRVSDKKVVSPRDNSYLYPTAGARTLILETCWPPGSTAERLLIFAQLVPNEGKSI